MVNCLSRLLPLSFPSLLQHSEDVLLLLPSLTSSATTLLSLNLLVGVPAVTVDLVEPGVYAGYVAEEGGCFLHRHFCTLEVSPNMHWWKVLLLTPGMDASSCMLGRRHDDVRTGCSKMK